jgi:outer membrane protein assembly factor BamB
MSDTQSHQPSTSWSPETEAPLAVSRRAERRLRLWPGVVLIAVLWLLLTVPGWLAPATMIQFFSMFIGPSVITVLLVIWWMFFSRLHWTDRFQGLFAFAVAGGATYPFWHQSLKGDESKGLSTLMVYVLPVVTTAWVGWLVVTPFLRWPIRRAGLVVVLVLAWGVFALVRYEGVAGDLSATFKYRGTPTAEEEYLAERAAQKGTAASAVDSAAPPALAPSDWPGFRGPNRDGRVTGIRIATDWQKHAPRELWRHRIGPGWSSFAVVGDRVYTQEQRGQDEAVVCFDAGTGKELWAHEDAARFSESLGGVGPRATPTYHDGKIYALGATGLLNCLDAASGDLKWSHNIADDSGAKVPNWGFASSPLVAEGVVMVFAGGPDGKSVLGYNASSGDLIWSAGEGRISYCSLQPARLDGSDQAIVVTETGLTSFQPADGTILWRHDWPVPEGMSRVVQPTLVGDSDVLLGTSFGFGTRRVHVGSKGDKWPTTELWTTQAIKPYYNDLVVHRGHLYGFDGNFFTCVSLDDGQSKWRARGYGNGQVLLLADQDLLLILSEKGEVALLRANPDQHQVLGRFAALDAKTWNHPVVARGKLFVRNGVEVACYELAGENAKGDDGK